MEKLTLTVAQGSVSWHNGASIEGPVYPFMPTVSFYICCPRDAVSRTANVERSGGHERVKPLDTPVL